MEIITVAPVGALPPVQKGRAHYHPVLRKVIQEAVVYLKRLGDEEARSWELQRNNAGRVARGSFDTERDVIASVATLMESRSGISQVRKPKKKKNYTFLIILFHKYLK